MVSRNAFESVWRDEVRGDTKQISKVMNANRRGTWRTEKNGVVETTMNGGNDVPVTIFHFFHTRNYFTRFLVNFSPVRRCMVEYPESKRRTAEIFRYLICLFVNR